MKKIAVVYKGKHGSTRRYAEWIREETGADLYRLEECSGQGLAAYDTVIFGGAIHAGGILGIDVLQKMYMDFSDKQVVAFAVGLNVDDEEVRKSCREVNFERDPGTFRKLMGTSEERKAADEKFKTLPCFFFHGAYDPETLTRGEKTMMKVVRKMIESKGEFQRTASEDKLLDAIKNGADFVDRSEIAPLIEEVTK